MKTLVCLIVGLSFLGLAHTKPAQAVTQDVSMNTSSEEEVADSQQAYSSETDDNWMTCYRNKYYCSEINLDNIIEIKREDTEVIFFHNIAYKTSNLTTVCRLGNLKYGRHCLPPDVIKQNGLPAKSL